MDRPTPSWLDETFLATALQGGENNEPRVTIVNFSTKPAVAVGENYTSHMFRIQVRFKVGDSAEEKSESLIFKAPIRTGIFSSEVMEEWDFYEVEPRIYNEILVKMFDKTKYEFGPKTLFSAVKGALVLKDVNAEGYVMSDKYKQLDFDHSKKVLESLANYHAASVAIHHDDPKLIEKLGEERAYVSDSPMTQMMKSWTESSVNNFVEVLDKIGNEKVIVDFIQNRVNQCYESLVNFCKPKAGRLNVLNHGDFWCNNMLFKHSASGNVVDVKFIDYQLPRFNSPVLDITYFIWTSVHEDVRHNNLQDLFDVYLHALNKSFEQLGCEERMTFGQLQEDIKLSTDWVIVILSFMRLFIFSEPENAVDMGKYSADDFASGVVDKDFKKIYSGRRYKALLPGVTRDFKTWISSYLA